MSATSVLPDRCILEGVPRVGFYGDVKDCGGKPWPEDFIFPSCLRSILEYHGDTYNDYVRILGVSGSGFFLNWGGWDCSSTAVYFMSADVSAVFTHTFDAIGYESSSHCGANNVTPEKIRDIVIREINAERPCMCHGVVGPPETSLITGYDEGGDVLIGWSFFQSEAEFAEGLGFEPNGYFRKRDWEPVTWDVMTVGEKTSEPDVKETFRKALEWGLQVARTPTSHMERPNGIAAYDAWADHLLRDDEIANWRPGDSRDKPFEAHRCASGVIAEGRCYLSNFIARDVPSCMPYQASRLYAAASCYAKEHELMWELWNNEGDMTEAEENFADPAVRRRSADIIKQARDFDTKAADHIEAALTAS